MNTKYRLTHEARMDRVILKDNAMKALLRGESVKFTKDQLELLKLPEFIDNAPDADGPGSGRYDAIQEW